MPTVQIQIKDGKSRTKKIKYHNPLKQAVLTTLSFFDILKQPLKLKQIHKYLFRTAASTQDVAIILKRLQGESIVQEQRGYFFLQSKSLADKTKRKIIKKKLLSKAIKAKNILQHLPFIRTIAIRNSLAFGNVNKNSDIDLLIITKKNRIYFTRILAILALKIFNLYQNQIDEPKKISLGFFIDEEGLNIEKTKITGNDPHQIFWAACIKPIYGFKYYYRFCRANLWLKKELPNFYPLKGNLQKKPLAQKILEFMLAPFIADWIEYLSRKLQQKRIFSLPENSWPTSSTTVKKHILKLHAIDDREYFRDKLEEKLRENLKMV